MEREPIDREELTAKVAKELGRPLAAASDAAKSQLRRAKRRAERGDAAVDPAVVAEAEVRLRLLKRQQRALKHALRPAPDADEATDPAGGEPAADPGTPP